MNNEERVIVTVRDGMSPDMNEGDPVIDCAVESLHKGRGVGSSAAKGKRNEASRSCLCPTTEEGHDPTSEHETSNRISQLGVRAVDHLFVEQELVCEELKIFKSE